MVKGGRPDGSRDRLARTFQSRKKVLTCRPWDRWARAVRMAATAASKAARPLTGPALSLGSGRMPGRGWWCRAVRGQHEAGRRNDVEEAPATISNLPRRRKIGCWRPIDRADWAGKHQLQGHENPGGSQGANRSPHSPNAMALEGRALSWSCIVLRDAMRQARNMARCAASNQTAPTPLLLSLSRPPRTPVAARATSQHPVSTQRHQRSTRHASHCRP